MLTPWYTDLCVDAQSTMADNDTLIHQQGVPVNNMYEWFKIITDFKISYYTFVLHLQTRVDVNI